MRGLSVAVLGWLLYEGSSATDCPGEQLTIMVTTTETTTVCPLSSSLPLTPASYQGPSSMDTSTLTSTSTLTIYITETRTSTKPDGNTTTLTEALPVSGTPATSFPYTGTPASSVPYSSISASGSNVTSIDSDPLATSSLPNLTTPTSLGNRPNLTTPLPASVLTSSRNGSYGGQVPTPPPTTVLPDPLSSTTSGSPLFTAGAVRAAGGLDVAAAAVAALVALL